MDFDVLMARALISRYHELTWFRGAELKEPYLFVKGDAAHIMFVEHMWLTALQAVIPGLEIRPALTEAPIEKPKPSAFKASYLRRLEKQARQGELL